MTTVYVLAAQEDYEGEDVVGVYSTLEAAQAATPVSDLYDPSGYTITAHVIDGGWAGKWYKRCQKGLDGSPPHDWQQVGTAG